MQMLGPLALAVVNYAYVVNVPWRREETASYRQPVHGNVI